MNPDLSLPMGTSGLCRTPSWAWIWDMDMDLELWTCIWNDTLMDMVLALWTWVWHSGHPHGCGSGTLDMDIVLEIWTWFWHSGHGHGSALSLLPPSLRHHLVSLFSLRGISVFSPLCETPAPRNRFVTFCVHFVLPHDSFLSFLALYVIPTFPNAHITKFLGIFLPA